MALAAFFGDSSESLQMVYGCRRKEQIEALVDFIPGTVTSENFARLLPYATFINTGQGATVDETAILAVMAARPDLTVLLDVTWPEPPDPASSRYRLENVIVSPHNSGSQGHEVVPMADTMIAEIHLLLSGMPLRYSVSLEQLKTMA